MHPIESILDFCSGFYSILVELKLVVFVKGTIIISDTEFESQSNLIYIHDKTCFFFFKLIVADFFVTFIWFFYNCCNLYLQFGPIFENLTFDFGPKFVKFLKKSMFFKSPISHQSTNWKNPKLCGNESLLPYQ